MTTDKNRVQTYIDDELRSRVRTYAEENQLSESKAIEQILLSFFQDPKPKQPVQAREDFRDQINDVVTERLQDYQAHIIYKVEQELGVWNKNIEQLIEERISQAIDKLQLPLKETDALLNEEALAVPYIKHSIDKSLQNPDPIASPLYLNQQELAKRLKVSASTLFRRKLQKDFKEWTWEKDPDRLSWEFIPQSQLFHVAFPPKPLHGDEQGMFDYYAAIAKVQGLRLTRSADGKSCQILDYNTDKRLDTFLTCDAAYIHLLSFHPTA